MTRSIRTVIVDDEPLARERLRTLLAAERDVELLAECRNGPEALDAVDLHRPDVLFLDVQMPGVDGIEVLEELGPAAVPVVIFVTAHDRYAIQAFDHHALDYLLKPFDPERFRRALQRARERLSQDASNDLSARLANLVRELAPSAPERLLVREEGRLSVVKVADIAWIEAQGNYVKLHARDESPLLRRTMKDLETRLEPAGFVRIHRSAIVNLDRVRELRPLTHGELLVVLDDGTELTSNRDLASALRSRFEG